MLRKANEADADEASSEDLSDGFAEPSGAALRWLYTPDLTSESGWDAYYIRPQRATRRPAGFRPVRVRGDEDPGRSR